jgi:lysophospholipase L1-like esterase
LLAILTFAAASAGEDAAAAEAERQWGEAIRAFEDADRRDPPPPGGILFVGSSSIRLWKLDEHFPDLPVINRGFGGSQISDTLHFADRIILPYKPRIVVLYAGDNDIAAGETPEHVAGDFLKLLAKVHDALPETQVAFISIKPSIARWSLYDKMKEANDRIKSHCDEDERLTFIDVATPMLGGDGHPRSELLADDGLHLSETGYELSRFKLSLSSLDEPLSGDVWFSAVVFSFGCGCSRSPLGFLELAGVDVSCQSF